MNERLSVAACLPADLDSATMIGRVWVPEFDGPVVARVKRDGVYDLSTVATTTSALFDLEDPVSAVRAAYGARWIASLEEVLANSAWKARDEAKPWFLAPCDLQAIKASGVTFVSSLLERVIEEQARGDPAKAEAVRKAIVAVIGEDLASVRPGSPEAARLKDVLIKQGAWSQYLEVGIGPDAEIFTKAQPMSSVGIGAEIGIHPKSEWNNPEPEVVLAVDSRSRTLGATLGNDVNLRDFEGRSALLLGKAKDNNASCAIGPFIRLFDDTFTLDDVRKAEVGLSISGDDQFTLKATSSMAKISRDPLNLVEHAGGKTHQYPDGMMLFLGTMFAPTQDRDRPGAGFTHKRGDIVSIATPTLGALVNRVSTSDAIAPWSFGVGSLMQNLRSRGLL